MRKFLFLLLALISQGSLASDDFVVAKVNNAAITYSEVLERYNIETKLFPINIKYVKNQQPKISQILEKMIEEDLIIQEAAQLGIEVSEFSMNGRFEFEASKYNKTPAQFKSLLAQKNLSLNSYIKKIKADLIWLRIVREMIEPKIKVTDIEARELYETKGIEIDTMSFHIAEIFIPNSSENAKQLAEKITQDLKNGENFNSMVKRFSQGSTTDNKGDLGSVSRREVDPAIYAAISHLEDGQYSAPVKLEDGYHIFKLISKAAIIYDVEKMSAARVELFGQKSKTASAAYINNLKRKAFIEIKTNKISK